MRNTNEARENGYKTCRRFAGLTQEEAAPLIGVATRTLQGYEAKDYEDELALGNPVPEDVVDRMVEVYKTPLLAWWHFRNGTRLGRHMPDVQLPQTPGDAGFMTVLACRDAKKAQEIMEAVLADGRVDASEHDDLRRFQRDASTAADRLLSAKIYVDTLLIREGGGRSAGM